MPNKDILENYPLYKKMIMDNIPPFINKLEKPPIIMKCNNCKQYTTFNMKNEYYSDFPTQITPTNNLIIRAVYICMHCNTEERQFFVKIDKNLKWIMKVGQYPSWDINGDQNIEKMLGEYNDYYKKGLICEYQGYGIGSFGYYRRIVEEIIGELLEDIAGLMTGEELVIYNESLERTKKTIVAQEKIELVKELLPTILRPGGINPLQSLHSILSEGLHAKTDEECLEYSDQCRSILIFLVYQISVSKKSCKRIY